MTTRFLLLLTTAIAVEQPAGFADKDGVGGEYPFPVIEQVPERTLLRADGNGYPSIRPGDKARVAELAASPDTPDNLRFYSIWGLAISGYSPEAAEGLAKAAEDKDLNGTARNYAAMGLSNFTGQLGKDERAKLQVRLRKLVEAESASCPHGILRTLIAWGDASWIAETLGEELLDHPMELEVLEKLPKGTALPRLVATYLKTPPAASEESYNRRAAVGRALASIGEKEGIDILATLLPAESVPTIDGSPNHQYRHNVFRSIERAVGKGFEYPHLNYHPSLDEAIGRFLAWWELNRESF